MIKPYITLHEAGTYVLALFFCVVILNFAIYNKLSLYKEEITLKFL